MSSYGSAKEEFEVVVQRFRRWESPTKRISCPDGIEGCLVMHYESKPGPLEIKLLELVNKIDTEARNEALSWTREPGW